jgi:hypothetical protein
MKTVVSIIRFPPPPKPSRAMNTAKETQFGAAPAIMQNAEQRKRDTLKANLLPITSPLNPRNKAPNNIPIYTAMTSPRWYDGLNS